MIISERNVTPKRISRTVLNYTRKKEIGSGTFGKVFEASRNGMKYAIKKFTYAKEAYHLTTLREIKALRAIKSRHVLQIKEIVVENFQIYLVFDFYDYDLYRMIGVENFTLCDIKHIFWQVLRGVEAIHGRGYLHRDLKTANILIEKASRSVQECFPSHRAKNEDRPASTKFKKAVHSERSAHNDGVGLCVARRSGCSGSKNCYEDQRSYCTLDEMDGHRGNRKRRVCECSDKSHRHEKGDPRGADGAFSQASGKEVSGAVKDEVGDSSHFPECDLMLTSSGNYPHNPSGYEVKICDFGMARQRSREMTQGVVTLWYRAPELLLGLTTYSKAVDVWSLGCILLEFFRKKPIFKANTEVESLEMIAELCGTINEQSVPCCANYPLYPKYNLKEGTRCIAERFSPYSAKAADLADRMLVLDPEKRISIEECLQHPFFGDL